MSSKPSTEGTKDVFEQVNTLNLPENAEVKTIIDLIRGEINGVLMAETVSSDKLNDENLFEEKDHAGVKYATIKTGLDVVKTKSAIHEIHKHLKNEEDASLKKAHHDIEAILQAKIGDLKKHETEEDSDHDEWAPFTFRYWKSFGERWRKAHRYGDMNHQETEEDKRKMLIAELGKKAVKPVKWLTEAVLHTTAFISYNNPLSVHFFELFDWKHNRSIWPKQSSHGHDDHSKTQ